MWSHQLIFLFVVTLCICHKMRPRVMNGTPISIDKFPYVVALFDVTGPGKHEYVFGTGTILSERWVVTAAHLWLEREDVLTQHTRNNSFIRYGASSATYYEGTIVAIAEIHPNHQYKDISVYYKFDVAVLKTEVPMNLKPGLAQSISLSDKGVVYPPGTECELASYGRSGVASIDSEPRHLRYTKIAPLDDGICQEVIPLVNGLFCAYQEKAAVCEGDSGAPMVCKGKLYAIHTRGTVCDIGNEANIGQFLRIADARYFIRDTTGLQV